MTDKSHNLELNEIIPADTKERILVIDDEERIGDSLSSLLTGSGYEVAIFRNSAEAADEIRRGYFDLILSDIKMPDLSGIDLLKLAREVDPQALVVLMTGYGSLESALEAIGLGAYDYLLKPVEFPQLELVIRRGLEKRRLGRAKSYLLNELKQKNEALEARLREINALYEAGKTVSSTLQLNRLLDSIIGLATEVLEAKIGSVMLLDDNREFLSIAAARGLDAHIIKSTQLPLGSSIAGHVAESGEPLFISNVEADHRFQRDNRQERYGPASLLSVPLIISNRTIGVINIAHKQSGGDFSEHDLKVLQTFANQAAVAIDHAATFKQLKRRVSELSAIQDIADAMSRAVTVQNLQEIIYWGIRNLMPADLALWFRWSPIGNTLNFVGGAGTSAIHLEMTITADGDLLADPIKARDFIMTNLPTELDPPIPHESFFAFPIFGSTGLDYVFCLASSLPDCFSDDDIKIAGLIASQAATMYEREKAILNATRLLTMGNMISEISHDMRKPLTNIRGSLQIMRDRWPEIAENSELFIMAEEEVHRLNELVRELVDFSNPNKYETERTDIAAVLKRAAHLVKPDLEKHNIACVEQFAEDTGEVFVNKNQIMEIFLNLIMNAIDAIGNDGTITLRTSRETKDRRAMVRIEIEDTGCGISDADKGAIFDRYFTTKETGTGLGLAVVERIISAHNGRIEVKSEVGKGTTFILHFPA